jgi:hypothetical protein
LKYQSVDFAQSIVIGIRYWLIAQFLLSAFVALSLMASAIFKKPFSSLVFCFVAYIFMPIITFFVPYISLYDKLYFQGLFFHNSLELLFSMLMYVVFTGIFLIIGYQIFKRTDL